MNSIRFSFRHIDYFIAVAETGSTAAARALFRAPDPGFRLVPGDGWGSARRPDPPGRPGARAVIQDSYGHHPPS
jgi:hypothetical protein